MIEGRLSFSSSELKAQMSFLYLNLSAICKLVIFLASSRNTGPIWFHTKPGTSILGLRKEAFDEDEGWSNEGPSSLLRRLGNVKMDEGVLNLLNNHWTRKKCNLHRSLYWKFKFVHTMIHKARIRPQWGLTEKYIEKFFLKNHKVQF